MGWASGSDVAYQMIKSLKKNVKDDKTREKVYSDLITVLEDHDCQCLIRFFSPYTQTGMKINLA